MTNATRPIFENLPTWMVVTFYTLVAVSTGIFFLGWFWRVRKYLRGRPVRLNFRREESTACTEQVIFGDFGLSKILPQGQTVPIEFTPKQAGEFTFHCGMNMVRGKLIVRPRPS